MSDPLTPDPCAWSGNCEAIATTQRGAAFYEAHANDSQAPDMAATLLVVVSLSLAFLLLSSVPRRSGRRGNNRKRVTP